MTIMRKTTLALAAAGLFGMSTASQALPLYFNTLLEDDNFEFQAVDTNQNGLLDVGDTLRGVFDITKIINQDNPAQNYDPLELTGIFETEVKSKTGTGPLYDFTFGPVGSDTGVIFKFYADGSNNFFVGGGCATIAGCEANATDGTLWAEFGFTGDLDEEWKATGAPDDPSFFTTIDSATAVGNFRFGLGIITDNTGYTLGPVSLTGCGILYACAGDKKVGLIGSGSLLGTSDLNTPYLASSDTDFKISAVPVPAPLALMAIGLLGMGVFGSRKTRS
jgi:hypothetical protein